MDFDQVDEGGRAAVRGYRQDNPPCLPEEDPENRQLGQVSTIGQLELQLCLVHFSYTYGREQSGIMSEVANDACLRMHA